MDSKAAESFDPNLIRFIMDKKTYTIGILSLSAVILFVANLIMPPRAAANFAVKDRDYQMISAAIQPGDEGVYVLDNRTGNMALFVYNPTARSLQAKEVRPIMAAFQNK